MMLRDIVSKVLFGRKPFWLTPQEIKKVNTFIDVYNTVKRIEENGGEL